MAPASEIHEQVFDFSPDLQPASNDTCKIMLNAILLMIYLLIIFTGIAVFAGLL